MEISALAWRDATDHCAYCLRVAQTPATGEATEPETTRSDVSLDPLTRVVSAQGLRHLRYVITAGYDSTQQCLGGVRALGLHQIGTLRIDANLRSLDHGPQRQGAGRPKVYDGTTHWEDLSRLTKVETSDDDLVRYPQVLNPVPCQRNLRVVLVVDPTHHRRAVLFRTDLDLVALTLSRSYKARFPIELLLRDAKQFTGCTDCQARSHAKRTFHFNASLCAVTFATLEARQQHGEAA